MPPVGGGKMAMLETAKVVQRGVFGMQVGPEKGKNKDYVVATGKECGVVV